jgi:hypothetical protein
MNNLCDLLGTPDAPVLKIASVKGFLMLDWVFRLGSWYFKDSKLYPFNLTFYISNIFCPKRKLYDNYRCNILA